MVIMFFADGFEETEAIAPLDILRRAGLDVKTVSIYDRREVTGSHNITYTTDLAVTEFDAKAEYQAVILPGGMPGTTNLGASDAVKTALITASANGSVIAAICAAPSVLGENGLLRGKRATCYPGFEDKCAGAKMYDAQVVCDGNVITGRAMGAACEFGLALAEKLAGTAASKKVASSAFIK